MSSKVKYYTLSNLDKVVVPEEMNYLTQKDVEYMMHDWYYFKQTLNFADYVRFRYYNTVEDFKLIKNDKKGV